MRRLWISNQLSEETLEGDDALPADYLAFLGKVAHRMLWLADAGDVLVLPSHPDPDFCSYVWRVLGQTDDPPLLLVPPPGRQGTDLLYTDRLTDAALIDRLREEAAEDGFDEVRAFFVDSDVAKLACALGVTAAVPAFDFLTAGGNELVNSKSVFRTICRGNRVDVPDGDAFDEQAAAAEFAWRWLAEGEAVIVKQDAHGGGYGNVILTPLDDDGYLGACEVVRIDDRQALATHLAAAWPRYTYQGRRPVVVEHYLRGCTPIYLELALDEDGVHTVGFGEMRMKPVNNGLVIPPPSGELPAFAGFLASGARLGQAYRALGYRGEVSLDAIVTPDGRILFNELNGRFGGSTHVHRLAELLIGPGVLRHRVLIARNRCDWESVATAVKVLAEEGLEFDPDRRTGVLVTGDDGQLLFVAADLAGALELERAAVGALGLSG